MILLRASKFVGLSRCKASLFRISSTTGLRLLLLVLLSSGSYGSVACEALLSRAGSVAKERGLLRPLFGRIMPACSSMASGGCDCGLGGDLLRSLAALLLMMTMLLLMMTMLRAGARVDVLSVC